MAQKFAVRNAVRNLSANGGPFLPNHIVKRIERFERIAEFCRRKRVFQKMLPLVAAAIIVSIPSPNFEKGDLQQTKKPGIAQVSSAAVSDTTKKIFGWSLVLGPAALIVIMGGAILKDRSKERKNAFDAPSSETGIEGDDMHALLRMRGRSGI